MLRRQPLRRSCAPLKRTGRLRACSKDRQKDNRSYAVDREEYLALHPFCQIAIAMARVHEVDVVAGRGLLNGRRFPLSTQIHHRNKARGGRKNDQRWWMACCTYWHDEVENDKRQARLDGFLLPFEADVDGVSPGGQRALPTPEFMASRAE